MTHYSIAERVVTTSCPLPAAEEAGRTQTSPHLCVCAAAASVVHLTRCLGQVWSLHSHCLVPFKSFMTGWATAGFKTPANRMMSIAGRPTRRLLLLFHSLPTH